MPRILLVTLVSVLVSLGSAAGAQAYAPLEMGLHDPGAADGSASHFDKMNDAGAGLARLAIYWSRHVPGGTEKPAGFDGADPADPRYDWTTIDAFVRAAGARHMDVLLTTLDAPAWAEGVDAADRAKRFGDAGTYRPDPSEVADFHRALATRYSGTFPDPQGGTLPRVRYFQVWNEPNFGQYLTLSRQADIPRHYTKMLNASYDAIKSVSRSDVVLAAGLGPYGNNGHATDLDPQAFMRAVLCVSGVGGRKLRDRPCSNRPKFDVWAQHPYTFGGTPTTKAGSVDGASIGNMPDIKRTLDFAVKARNVLPRGKKDLWVSEFGWFSDPPGIRSGDGRQLGLPLDRQAAYLSESAYRVWRLGFRAFVWYGLGDQDAFPTGLYLGEADDGKAKPALDAFRFPFYADHGSRGVLVWGLVSRGGRTRVRIERRSGRSWTRVSEVRSDARGMIYTRVRGGEGTYRARALNGAKAGLTSRPFDAR